jgi:CO dehydrogenase nickel-insertion accessory protein CooC1
VSQSRNGQVITFYSYKGGTGRTMALANVAWIIASSGKHVLVVDWDLESPGLHKFFAPFLEESKVSATPGVIELINDYASEALKRTPRPDDWYQEFARVQKDAHSLEWDFPDGGKLDFLSAGRQNRDYSAAVGSLDWDNFYERLGGGRFFRALRDDMKKNYDYVLIDSRTGLSDVADICTIELPDVLTVCFTLSNQSIEGAANVARQISGRYRDRNIKVLPVPMRIEDGEKEKLDVGRSAARRQFEAFPQGLTQADSIAYWSGVEVPYKPFYAFEEVLATFGDEPGSPASLLASFERITAAVTGGEVTAMQPIPDELRLQYKELFARRAPAALTQVFLSYAPEDRMWADWIEAVLTQAGFRVTPRSTALRLDLDQEAEEFVAAAPRVVAVLSGTYMNLPEARSLWRTLSAADAAGIRRQIVPVRVSDTRIAEPFNEHTPVDLARADALQAATRLLWAFDRPWQVPGTGQASGPRYPSAMPRIDNAPTRNHDFTGRAHTLEQLRDRLSGSSAASPQALHGLGGVGKTQLAQEYAHRFKADYDLVWWAPAERTEEISASLADLARHLQLRVGDNVAEAAETALAELRKDTSPRWLLIFDNADNPAQLKPWLPQGNGHVIITSRNKEWTNTADVLEVDVFSREESVGHLIHHVPHLDQGDADQVAEALGDLPLAIEQASAWLEQTGMAARAYVEELSTRATRILSLNRPPDYPTPVVATWDMSFDRLRERSPAAVRLLQILAFCSPEPISTDLLYSDATIQALLPYDSALSERLMLGRIIRDISRFALVKVDPGSNSLQIHRLVQAVIQEQMTAEEQLDARHELHKILVGARPERDADDPANWAALEIIWPHLGPSQAEECVDPRTRQLLIDWVRYLWKAGEFESCLNLASRLEATWSHLMGEDNQQTLLLRFHIANVLRSQGRFREARDVDLDVLGRQTRVLGSDHPNTLMTAGGLGADLKALGDYQQPLESDKQTYASFKELFGEDHPRTLMAANNLADSYRLNGDYQAALHLDQDSLERQRVVLAVDHPYTLDTMASVALELRAEGEFRESVDILRDTLARYHEVLGEDHAESLRTATSLAVSLRKAGDQAEAMKLAQDAYNRYERHFGRQSPGARICALNLACDYAADGDFPRALDLALDVKAALTAQLGDDHPNTLVAANNLACYLRAVGRYAEARQLAEDATAGMRHKLGERHPMTLSAAINLSNCLADARDFAAAEALQRSTLAVLSAVLGPGHPDTLTCQADLAVTLRDTGRLAEAEELTASALAGLERDLGKGHPDIAQLQSGQRINRDLEPQSY